MRAFCSIVFASILAWVPMFCASAAEVSFTRLIMGDGDGARRISGILHRPVGEGPFAAVILLHSCGGMESNILKDWPEFLTGQGYVTLIVDSFGSRGIARCPTPLSRDHVTLSGDVFGAHAYLRSLPLVDRNRTAVMGFALGGNTIDHMAGQSFANPIGAAFMAAVSIYGRCATMLRRSSPLPTLVIIGDRDEADRLAPCRALAAGSSPNIAVNILPDVHHAFDNDRFVNPRGDSSGNLMLYSHEATQRARQLVAGFLAEHLRDGR